MKSSTILSDEQSFTSEIDLNEDLERVAADRGLMRMSTCFDLRNHRELNTFWAQQLIFH